MCQKIGKLLADLLVGGFTQNKDLWIRFSFFLWSAVCIDQREECAALESDAYDS